MLISESVNRNDVECDFKGQWCECQVYWKKEPHILCTADLCSGRVFDCPFTGPDDPKLSGCPDYRAQKGKT